jgi:transcriptional regulator with XRE-family HTH domain
MTADRRPSAAFWRDFAARLRGYRTQTGLSQATVAQRIGMSRTSYVNIEAGKQRVDAYRLGQLAHLFGVTADALIRGPIPTPQAIQQTRPPILSRILRALR